MTEERPGTAAFEWTNRYQRALDRVRATSDRQQFLEELVNASILLGGAAKAHAMLMDRTTVVAETGRTSEGVSYPVPEDHRKHAARVASNIGKQGASTAPRIEADNCSFLVSFHVKEGLAGALCLEHENGSRQNGGHDALVVALALAAAAGLRAREAELEANERANQAEARVREVEASVASGGIGAVAYLKTIAELERDAIELALRTTNWNKEEAARRLGISRASIYMKVRKFDLKRPAQP
ncbi:MAG: helix-turn-helix domain-containing protein [Planctomycetes bacterium]|nr:helix-turn-helix domain-containing protein [Planctomycetota bacterium]